MNNEQFRRLLVDQGTSKSKDSNATPARDASRGGATPGGLLGSRMRSSIPMTPRSVTGVDFGRQLAEQRQGDRPSKRFKSSAAPKGTALPTGYQDRAQLRNAKGEDERGEDIETRIKALEDMVKLGQIDQATFDKLRKDLGVGGDLRSTHMVKGLDMDLLRRVRAGEDVSQAAEKPAPPPEELKEDADEEFERLMEEKGLEEVAAAPKEQKEKKKGNMAPPPAKPKTRDDILRELKAKRAAAAAPAPPPESTLSSKFKKLSDGKPEKKRFIERDETGRRREVLLITDAQGNTKRKTRWLDKPIEATGPAKGDLPMPDKAAEPLGMEVPAEIAARSAPAAPEDEDEDIFAGVGDDYNPLAGLEGDDDSSSDEEGETGESASRKPAKDTVSKEDKKPTTETAPAKPRNYFGTSTTEEEPEDRSNPLTKDPTILAALKRAAALRQTSPSEGEEGESPEAALRHKRFIEEARRRDAMDAADMDMGFGESRVEDGEEDDQVLFDFDDDNRGGKKRKRGPKKKKGDKDSVADVMRVVEGRKKDAS
ncbi:hypothetical protein N7467_010789 [Penicillium canescens]|nr:hypothetical protein N7467_010789 [Penicillium canescens]